MCSVYIYILYIYSALYIMREEEEEKYIYAQQTPPASYLPIGIL